MAVKKSLKIGGFLFILAGLAFGVVAVIGGEKSNYGLGIMFVLLGIAFIRKDQSTHSKDENKL